MTKKHFPRLRALRLALPLLFLLPGHAFAGDDELTLRINDTTAEPGGLAAVVLRTYASRGVGQGQICLGVRSTARGSTARGAAAGGPLLTLEQVVIFSELGDAQVIDSFDASAQVALIEFESLSAGINSTDGPMAVLFFRLASPLAAGAEFTLDIDEAATFLFDDQGLSIPVAPRSGTLTVRAPGAPYELAAEGDAVPPGGVAALGVETSELFAVWNGEVAFTYDPAFAAGPPVVTMDQRHGASSFTVDLTVAGRVVVSFLSANGSLNSIPGQLISIDLPTSAALPSGSRSPLALDPLATWLEDSTGLSIPLALAGDELVLGGSAIFADGFESGDVSRW